jgi:predicted deacylase
MTSFPVAAAAALRVHAFKASQPGPRLIVLGAVHGNETCGTRAIERVLAELDTAALQVVRGSVSFVPIANPLAYQRGQRSGERNLNRKLCVHADPQDFEDRIANVLCPLLAQHEALLDLHSFHTAGEPFAMIGPRDNTGPLEPFARAAEEEALALRLGPRRIVEGWLDAYARGVERRQQPATVTQPLATDASYGVGTTEFMRSQGGYAVTLECGQHADPAAPEVAYRAIRHTLAQLELVDEPAPTARADIELLRLAEVTDRQHPDDRLARAWASYDPVCRGDLIGTRADGTPLHAPADGFIVFPNPAALPGHEWFYFAQRSTRKLRADAPGHTVA